MFTTLLSAVCYVRLLKGKFLFLKKSGPCVNSKKGSSAHLNQYFKNILVLNKFLKSVTLSFTHNKFLLIYFDLKTFDKSPYTILLQKQNNLIPNILNSLVPKLFVSQMLFCWHF